MPCAAHAEEHALNARIDSEIQTLLQPLLVVVEQASATKKTKKLEKKARLLKPEASRMRERILRPRNRMRVRMALING